MTTFLCVHQLMNDEDVVYYNNGILLNYKINEIIPFAETWMHLEPIKLSEKGQRKIKNHMMSLICEI